MGAAGRQATPDHPHRLPVFPDIPFRLLAPRQTESALVAEVRGVIGTMLG